MNRRFRKIIILLILFFGFFALISAFLGLRAIKTTQKALSSIQHQDLEAAKKDLKSARNQFKITQTVMLVFTPIRVIPLFGWYVADAQRAVGGAVSGIDAAITFTDALTPYADVLGLNGQGDFLGGTAQERIAKGLETLSKVAPELDSVADNLQNAREQIVKIESWRYPNILPGKPGSKINAVKKGLIQVDTIFRDTKPLLVVLPKIMGQDGEKKYLILLQNDGELRPTGGFITAYAVFRVANGAIESEGSQDIYELDNSLLKKIPAPEPIVKYLPNVPTLNIRDSNLSPDFVASMDQFEQLYNLTSEAKDIDGIIALDTHFILSLLEVLGPVEADGIKYTTENVKECDCPHIIFELAKQADEPVAFIKVDRKGTIGVLMQQVMDKAFTSSKTMWPDLAESVLTSLKEKHIMMYLHDKASQEAVEKVNFAGRLYDYNGDYIHINEANFAGAKSNMYIKQKVKQVVKEEKNDTIRKTVTIEYKYPRKMDNCSLDRKGGLCLAGIYRDWIRIYVPKGSTLVKSNGFEVALEQKEDLGKTVFEGFLTVRPESAVKVDFEYTVPLKTDKEYKLFIQKQPGADGPTYELEAFGKKQKGFTLNTDKEFIIKL